MKTCVRSIWADFARHLVVPFRYATGKVCVDCSIRLHGIQVWSTHGTMTNRKPCKWVELNALGQWKFPHSFSDFIARCVECNYALSLGVTSARLHLQKRYKKGQYVSVWVWWNFQFASNPLIHPISMMFLLLVKVLVLCFKSNILFAFSLVCLSFRHFCL